MEEVGSTGALLPRQNDAGETLFRLLKNYDPALSQQSIWAAVGTSIGFTALIAILFSFLRPYNSVVYAPKLKHADDQHAPPPMGKGVFAWVMPIFRTKEEDLIRQVGLDAVIFLRFTRMCRDIFCVIAVLGCAILIPINATLSNSRSFSDQISWVLQLTPLNTYDRANWGIVICAWLFNLVVAGFLFWNYRIVLKLRRQYFDSSDYQNSLHARTLMFNDIPKSHRTDEGIGRLIDEIDPQTSFARCAIARNMKELPELIDQHNQAVRQLEKHLAKYLHNPDNLPKSRPMCAPSKDDPSYGTYAKGQKVDAIEYLTGRITELETEIKEIRLTLDKRDAMPYGFASYEDISEAHNVAFQARNKHPEGTTIVLAPRPNDVIWSNMPLNRSARRWRRIVNNLWITLLTLVYTAPNVMMSIFLVNLQNLGLVWPAFQTSLSQHTTWWAIVQGVASPAITSLIFLLLPILFRRLAIRAGDRTKTGRERHVTGKLYTFFVFNNLIVFSLFSSLFSFVVNVVDETSKGAPAWEAIGKADIRSSIFVNLCNITPFWVTYLLQRNLGAAVDLAQLWTLIWSFCARKFSSPTPRELIELTAPQAFDYASYYNYFLFYATVTLCFATIQPLVLPAAALYFAIDVYLKKYLLLYIFITKTESGGMFWRILFNRMVFAAAISNVVVLLVVWVRGDNQHMQMYAIIPLPLLMIAFKVYCRRVFDHKIHYYSVPSMLKNSEGGMSKKVGLKVDRLASRYGHPALYRPLITPMVHAKAQHMLASIYRGRLSDGRTTDASDLASVSGYSDTFALDPMRAGQPGRTTAMKDQPVPGFEVVPESQLDFSYYKNRAEFGEEHGAGQIYNRPTDLISRPGTSHTFRDGYSTPGSSRPASPAQGHFVPRRIMTGMSEAQGSEMGVPLVGGAAAMPLATAGEAANPLEGRAPGFLGGGPQGYGGLPQQEEEAATQAHDPMSYDYYRPKRNNAGWQGWTG